MFDSKWSVVAKKSRTLNARTSVKMFAWWWWGLFKIYSRLDVDVLRKFTKIGRLFSCGYYQISWQNLKLFPIFHFPYKYDIIHMTSPISESSFKILRSHTFLKIIFMQTFDNPMQNLWLWLHSPTSTIKVINNSMVEKYSATIGRIKLWYRKIYNRPKRIEKLKYPH